MARAGRGSGWDGGAQRESGRAQGLARSLKHDAKQVFVEHGFAIDHAGHGPNAVWIHAALGVCGSEHKACDLTASIRHHHADAGWGLHPAWQTVFTGRIDGNGNGNLEQTRLFHAAILAKV